YGGMAPQRLPHPASGRRAADASAEDLRPRPVGRCALAVVARSEQRPHAELRREGRDLLACAGLPDARLAGDEVEASAAGDRLEERRAQLGELRRTTDERTRAVSGGPVHPGTEHIAR